MKSLANLTSGGQRCGFQRPKETGGEKTKQWLFQLNQNNKKKPIYLHTLSRF